MNEDLKTVPGSSLINLASNEYFKAVKPKEVQGDLINIHFKEKRGDVLKVIAFNAKKARGAMAKQIIKYKIKNKEHLKALEVNDYIFDEYKSDEVNYVFIKDK